MHRVRVGLTGLAFVFLLVMLATAFLRGVDHDAPNAAATANAASPAEPLAELGVVPGNPPPVVNAPPPIVSVQVPPPGATTNAAASAHR